MPMRERRGAPLVTKQGGAPTRFVATYSRTNVLTYSRTNVLTYERTNVLTHYEPTGGAHSLTYCAHSLTYHYCSPVVMKKSPSSRPRKGAISASIWKRNLVSARRTPARNWRGERRLTHA